MGPQKQSWNGFYQGDKVQWQSYLSPRRRVGVVVGGFPPLRMVKVVDFQTGDVVMVETSRLDPIHGYLHLDTPQRMGF